MLIPTSRFEETLSIARNGLEFVWEVSCETNSKSECLDIPHDSFQSLSCYISEQRYLVSICGSMAKPKWMNDNYELTFSGYRILKLEDVDLIALATMRYVKGEGYIALLGKQQVTWISLSKQTYVGCEGSRVCGLLFLI